MLEVRSLTKRFREKVAVDRIDLTMEEGEVFGCLGPNGAGKTTTMRLILGLLRPTGGDALLWGERASESPEVRRRIGVLLESDGLYLRLTAYDNLDYFARLYGVEARNRRIEELLEFTGLADRARDRVGTFSRGMRRKLGLARSLLHSPDLLMLDEPSAGLDPEAQKMVRDLIIRLSSESRIAVFLSSHDLDEVQRICNRVAILQHGRVRVNDTLRALQSSDNESVEITLVDPSRHDDAVRLLQQQGSIGSVAGIAGRLSLALRQGQGGASLAAVLEAGGIAVEEMRRSKRSLEEVYLDVVRQEADGE